MGNAKGNKIEPAKNVKTEFELEDLSLSQDFGSMVGVKKVVTTVPVRKPHKQEFVRVRPEDDFHFSTAVIEIKEDKEIFLVENILVTFNI